MNHAMTIVLGSVSGLGSIAILVIVLGVIHRLTRLRRVVPTTVKPETIYRTRLQPVDEDLAEDKSHTTETVDRYTISLHGLASTCPSCRRSKISTDILTKSCERIRSDSKSKCTIMGRHAHQSCSACKSKWIRATHELFE